MIKYRFRGLDFERRISLIPDLVASICNLANKLAAWYCSLCHEVDAFKRPFGDPVSRIGYPRPLTRSSISEKRAGKGGNRKYEITRNYITIPYFETVLLFFFFFLFFSTYYYYILSILIDNNKYIYTIVNLKIDTKKEKKFSFVINRPTYERR